MIVVLLSIGDLQAGVANQMPVCSTDIFWQSDALLIPRFPLTVLIHGTAFTTRLFVTVIGRIILGTIVIESNRNLFLCAVVVCWDTLVRTPLTAVSVGCAAVAVCNLITFFIVYNY